MEKVEVKLKCENKKCERYDHVFTPLDYYGSSGLVKCFGCGKMLDGDEIDEIEKRKKEEIKGW